MSRKDKPVDWRTLEEVSALRIVQKEADSFAKLLGGGIPNKAEKFEILRRLSRLQRLVREAPVLMDPKDYD